MRYVYMALIVLLTAIVLAFKFQNLDTVTVTFFRASMTLPVSALVLLVYVLGMMTGGLLLSMVRAWLRGATRPAPGARQ